MKDCFLGMEVIRKVEPEKIQSSMVREIYERWKKGLKGLMLKA